MLDVTQLNPTFVCGHRASGGGLLISLLDYHPELLVYPDESKFFYLFYPIMLETNASTIEKIQCVKSKILEFTRAILVEKCSATNNHFDYSSFVTNFERNISDTSEWHNYLTAIIQAYADASPQPKNQLIRWVERTTSSEIYAHEINKCFPNCKFIHNIRDPRDNYASLKSRWHNKLRYLSDTTTLESLRQSCIERGKLGMEMGITNHTIFGEEKYIFSRYEDIVTDNANALKIIAEFLGIDADRFSHSPTFCGLPWGGNNFDKQKFDNVSSVQVGRWKERIDDHEAALIEFHFKDLMVYFGYKLEYSEAQQVEAAQKHYIWLNYSSDRKADFSLAEKISF